MYEIVLKYLEYYMETNHEYMQESEIKELQTAIDFVKSQN